MYADIFADISTGMSATISADRSDDLSADISADISVDLFVVKSVTGPTPLGAPSGPLQKPILRAQAPQEPHGVDPGPAGPIQKTNK